MHAGMLDIGSPFAEVDCVWSIPACNGELMDNGVAFPVMNACALKTATVLETKGLELRRGARFRHCHQIQGVTVLFRTPSIWTLSRGVFGTFFGEPSMANSCWSSRARGWRGRRESDSQVSHHM